MMAISIDLESVRFTRPGGRPRGSLAEHDARKPRFFRKRFLEKHIPRLGIYRLAGFVDFKRLPDRSLQVLTGCVTQVAGASFGFCIIFVPDPLQRVSQVRPETGPKTKLKI